MSGQQASNLVHFLIVLGLFWWSARNLDKKQYPEAFYWLGVAAVAAFKD